MSDTTNRVTRFAADLMDSAAAEGARQNRSAEQQLDHWARVGRAVSSQHSVARRKVEAARGVTTVALDDDGEIVLYAPDGSSSRLDRGT